MVEEHQIIQVLKKHIVNVTMNLMKKIYIGMEDKDDVGNACLYKVRNITKKKKRA